MRQEDTISPKLFTSTLESIFRRMNWENKGLKIDGEYLNHLRFADDIFLCTKPPQELEIMLQELCLPPLFLFLRYSSSSSLRMNFRIDLKPYCYVTLFCTNVMAHFSCYCSSSERSGESKDLTRFAIQAKGPDGKWTRKLIESPTMFIYL